MTWLTKPYYERPAQVKIDSPIRGFPPSVTAPALTIESYLQGLLASQLDDAQFWLNPNHSTFLSARTAQAIIDDFTWSAVNRVSWYPALANDGEDPVALGAKYGRLMVSIMQQINSGGVQGGTEGVSLWDAWTKMTEPVK